MTMEIVSQIAISVIMKMTVETTVMNKDVVSSYNIFVKQQYYLHRWYHRVKWYLFMMIIYMTRSSKHLYLTYIKCTNCIVCTC